AVTTAAAAAAAAAAITTATAAAAAAARTILTRLGFIDGECAAFVLAAVQTLDGCSRFRLTSHLDEAEALAPARVAIGDDLRALHIAECTKQFFEARTIDTEAQVTDVQLLTHCDELSLTRTGYPPA